jgi:hypothetical protein
MIRGAVVGVVRHQEANLVVLFIEHALIAPPAAGNVHNGFFAGDHPDTAKNDSVNCLGHVVSVLCVL